MSQRQHCSWLETAAQFSLLHWDDLEVEVASEEDFPDSPALVNQTLKVKCLRTSSFQSSGVCIQTDCFVG